MCGGHVELPSEARSSPPAFMSALSVVSWRKGPLTPSSPKNGIRPAIAEFGLRRAWMPSVCVSLNFGVRTLSGNSGPLDPFLER